MASAINASSPDQVYFCSCGTEANNAAIWGVVMHYNTTPHVISSTIEHPAILNYLAFAAGRGWLEFDLAPVDRQGIVDPDSVVSLLRPTTRLVSIMHANNEMGAVQPIQAIVQAIRNADPLVLVHTDAAQSFGKVTFDVQAMGVDMATIVGHKIGAPKGTAALYVRHGVELVPMLHGGGQERGWRGGTENVMLAAALGAAAEVARHGLDERRARLERLREMLVTELQDKLDVVVHGPVDAQHRLPSVLCCTIMGVHGGTLLARVRHQLAASSGAACHGSGVASGMLQALGVDPEVAAYGTLRLSVGGATTEEDVLEGVKTLIECCVVD